MHGQILEAEHLGRYAWACQFAEGKRVLDAACGTAYGVRMLLAAGASEVVGIDLAEGVVAAIREDAPAGASFDIGDICDLPYGDGEFDLVTCFEAIEHVSDPGRVLDELRRVLRPDGVVVLSTPNRDVYLPGNPFHLHELTPTELEGELSSRFGSVALRRQDSWSAAGIFDDEQFSRGEDSVIEGAELRKAFANEPGRETFTLAIAGDGELPADRPLVTLTSNADLRDWAERLERAARTADAATEAADARVNAELEFMRRELAAVRQQLMEAETELARLTGIEAEYERVLPVLRDHEVAAREYQAVVNSRSWKLTRPLRSLVARLRG